MALSIDIAANTRAAQRDVKDLSKALDDTADALDDVARDGDKAGDKIEASFRDMVREAGKAEKAVDDVKDSTRRLGDDGVGGFRKLKDAGSEASDELKQNLGETFSSFRGDLEDVPQIAQDVLGGLAGSVGGIPAALGLAGAAAGVGVIIENFTKIAEAADEAKESAFDMAYTVGGALDAAGYSQRLASWTGETEKWKQANDIAQATGWDVVDVVDAMAAGGDKLRDLSGAWGEGADAAQLTSGRLWELEAVLKATGEGYASGAQAAEINARALAEYAEKVGTATGETDALGNAIYLLPDNTEVAVNAQTGQATEDIKRLDEDIAAVPDTVNTRATFDASGAQRDVDNWVSRNNGRTIRIAGRFDVESGVPFE